MEASRLDADSIPDLRSRDSRARLARMVLKLFSLWQLDTAVQAALLGLSPDSRTTLGRYRKGEPLGDSEDLLKRVGHLLGIHKSLRILFPYDPDLVYRWVSTPNRRFEGRTPLAIMREYGYEGILMVRRYLDFERGR